MLEAGDPIPAAARLWVTPTGDPQPLGPVLAGPGSALLCFYPFDWSPT